MTNEPAALGPAVPPPCDGRRRKFTVDDKRRILAEASRPRTNVSEVARRYGIAVRVLFRWKQELAQPAELVFVSVAVSGAGQDNDQPACVGELS